MSKTMKKTLLFVTALASLTIANSGQAVTTITAVPYTISSPGIYVLGNNVTFTGSGSMPAIMINANNVLLDLNGNTLGNFVAGPATGAFGIQFTFHQNLVLQNGTIQGFSEGFFSQQSSNIVIDNVNFYGIISFAVASNSDHGIIIRNCQFNGIGYSSTGAVLNSSAVGIDVTGGYGGLILHNTLSQISGIGVILGSNCLADGNFIANAQTGFQCIDATSGLKNNVVTLSTNHYFGGTSLSNNF